MNTIEQPMTTPCVGTEGSGSPANFSARRQAFRTLHEAGCFVIPNPWDVGSARTCCIPDSPHWRRPARALRSRRGCRIPRLHPPATGTWRTSPTSRPRSMFRSMRTSRLATGGHRRTWPITSRAASRPASQDCQPRMPPAIHRRRSTTCRSRSSAFAPRVRRSISRAPTSC